jgi:hypothetical protein
MAFPLSFFWLRHLALKTEGGPGGRPKKKPNGLLLQPFCIDQNLPLKATAATAPRTVGHK